MKKIILLVLSFIMTVSTVSLTGCKKGNKNGNVLEIAVNIGGYGSDSFKAIARKFEEEHEGTEVNVSDVYLRADQLEANLKNPRASKTDLYVTGNGTMLKGYVSKGDKFSSSYKGVILEEISDVYNSKVDGEDITVGDKMYDQFREFHTWDLNDDGEEEHYIMPWHANIMSFIYNTTVVNKALNGKPIPRTTLEFEQLCKAIKADGVNPFVLTLDPSAHYWQGPVETWWAQYETVEEYNNFFRGISDGKFSKDIYRARGRLVGLKEMERFIFASNGYIHKNSPSFEFATAQNTLFSGVSAFMANGCWFENEMKLSDSKKDNIAMMKTPVTSVIVEKLSFYNDGDYFALSDSKKNEYDLILAGIVGYVDGNIERENLDARVKDSDIEIIRKARRIAKTNASSSSMFIPAFAKNKELAKEFLKFMVRDDNLVLFMNKSSGSHLVYDFDFSKEENKEVFNGLSAFRKSVYEIEKDCDLIRFVNEPIQYKGGLEPYADLSTQVESYMISANAGDRKTAQEIYDHCIKYMDDDRWSNILRLSGNL